MSETALAWTQQLDSVVFAFRGYNVTNLGLSDRLLEHPLYGPVVEHHLRQAARIHQQVTGRRADLVGRVRRRRGSSLRTFSQDIALILAMELAQIRLLQEMFAVDYSRAALALGYSLGEVSALVCGGVYELEDALVPLLSLAEDCAALGRTTRMGIVFSRGEQLDMDAIEELLVQINQEGRGLIGISSILSPNTVLLLGQGRTVDRFARIMHSRLPKQVHLRKNPHRWPPLHTPLLWARNVPNRAGVLMLQMPHGLAEPRPPIFSLATGGVDYNRHNSRYLMYRWIDHPQRLWDAVVHVLQSGATTVVHVGPEPNIIPATFRRLSDNVQFQLQQGGLRGLGLRAVGSLWRPWLANWVSQKAALLRAPYVEHIILEQWLLEHAPA